MEIITDIEKLSERADELDIRKENNLMREIILKLKETVRENNLNGLTAPQIGYNKRILVINFKGDVRSFINPIISRSEGFTLKREKCSSIPNKEFIRPRNTTIFITYQDPLGKIKSIRLDGEAAFVFQHELDHLDGLLLSDIGLELDKDFDKASDEEKNELLDAYLDSLDIKKKEMHEEINNDEMLKKTESAIDFMTKLQKGEVELGDQVSAKRKQD